ncbi:MAG: peptidase M24 [Bacteroidetes bacterium HGW-Bacteroidetes-8]|jgi:Xaa-Pro aminopeptidase|nr:MAG: peptidase M24 [Bacteroidetes bacterium HGW-Bacteroidetes-8]
MKKITERLAGLRGSLKRDSIAAFIIPSTDHHFGEYIQRHFSCREWLSGFTGSAGTLVVTEHKAALWTDSRYFVQARQELLGSGIELMKMRLAGTPTIAEWIKKEVDNGSSVGVDPMLFSKGEFESLSAELYPLKITLKDDPFNEIWSDRPPVTFNKATLQEISLGGSDSKSKLKFVIQKLNIEKDLIYILSSCDDIAWLCNIRGTDIPFNPLLISYAAFTKERIYLFASGEAFSNVEESMLRDSGVELYNYYEFQEFIKGFNRDYIRVAPIDKISVKIFNNSVSAGATFVPDPIRGGVIASLKAVKNSVEIDGFRKAMLYDGVAWVKFWIYLEEELERGSQNLTEEIVANKIGEIRGEFSEYKGESFSPIVAFGENGALPHYSPYGNGPVKIGGDSFLLVDTGAHYPFGTTDTTRTFAIGTLTQEQRRDYTLVLKGMINLSMARFIKGTRGASLDFLARGAVSSAAKIYTHGTGHGIGHNLCVHEGPQSIRMEENPVPLESGMVISNEPAIYEEGSYGIRIENTILCKKWVENKYGEFYEFETLTLVPIDLTPVDRQLLSPEAIQWLNNYHSYIYIKLSDMLNEKEREWLSVKTLNIN